MRYFQWLLLLVISIPLAIYAQNMPGKHVDTSNYVVLKYNPRFDVFFGKSDHLKPTNLSQSEVDNIEIFVDSAYQRLVGELPAKYQSLHPLSVYKRQYIPVINEKGQKEVWIGFLCKAPKDWRKGEIIVDDGGACYLRIWINLTLRKASKLYDNGVA